MVWAAALAVGLGGGLPVVAGEAGVDATSGVPTDVLLDPAEIDWDDLGGADPAAEPASEVQGSVDAGVAAKLDLRYLAGESGVEPSAEGRAPDEAPTGQMAQFQLPKPTPEGGAPTSQLPQRLVYQYGYGSESDTTYRTDSDLNKNVKDDSFIVRPEVNGNVTYRPANWLDMTLEMIIDREIAAREEDRVVLPNGEIAVAPERRASLLIDQAFVTIKDVISPFEFSVGRKDFQDERHFLYDTSMDTALVSVKLGPLYGQASVGREVLKDMDLLKRERTDRINTFIYYAEYRGLEDVKFAAYTILRDDRNDREGRPQLVGVRSLGMPTEEFSYWTELAHLRGSDERSRSYSAHAVDVGGTYRIPGVPLNPNITLGFALGTGDNTPNDTTNNQFRQTGLQSNEVKFGGVADFRGYGEALDPELSNLKVFTVGAGIRPAPNVSFDLIYHRYRLHELSEEIGESGVTAELNQVDTELSKDVGSAIDIVLGFRNLFGIKRLGLDLRAGWFFPGRAYFRDESTDEAVIFRDPDTGFSMITKFWW